MTNTFEHPVRRPSRVPAILFKIGAVALILGLIMGTVGVALLGDRLDESADDETQIRKDFTTEVPVSGVAEVYLEADTYDIVAIGNDLVSRDEFATGDRTTTYRSRNLFPEPDVSITRDGIPVPRSKPTGTTLVPLPDYDLVRLSTFEVSTAATYRIEVFGLPGPVTAIGIGESNNGDATNDALGGSLLVSGAVIFGFGAILMIPAAVWRLSNRKHRRAARSGPPPSAGPPPGPYPPVLDHTREYRR